MSQLRRTPLYAWHAAHGAQLVDFGGWEMPMQYEKGIVEEHLYTRSKAGLFDVSHMGRFEIGGPEAKAFLQHVLTNNVDALQVNQAQYTILPTPDGGAIDDAYLYRFDADGYLLVVNAANAENDKRHLLEEIRAFSATLTDVTERVSLLALQGPASKDMLLSLAAEPQLTEPMKNALGTVHLNGMPARVSKTGYTGEPIGYEIFIDTKNVVALWETLVSLGAAPVGLGARDTLRLEAGLPLFGHEMGLDKDGVPMPIFAVPLARFAVSFAEGKGDFIGRAPLTKQHEAYMRLMNRDDSAMRVLPKQIRPIQLTGRGIARGGAAVYKDGKEVGYVTSGTMVPYYIPVGEGLESRPGTEHALHAVGLALVDSNVRKGDAVEVDIRGKRVSAVIPPCHLRGDAPPYARPVVMTASSAPAEAPKTVEENYAAAAKQLLSDALQNHVWRQDRCINLIPSEMTASRAVRLLSASDPSFRYAEHKRIRSLNDAEVFYYQGTKFIDRVETLLTEEMKTYLGCAEVETRLLSGQMSNTTVFSALMDFKNRVNRRCTPKRLGYVLNNHIIKGGHLSAQPMGALHDYIAVDPVTEKPAVVNFPVCADNVFKIDVAKTRDILEQYRPEFIIFGKSMVLYHEPVREIRQFVKELGVDTTIMYDMAHVLGLVGPYFQQPFADGADIVTGSTHKTFFGPQRGVIGANFQPDELKYGLWETIKTRTFPGATSNHHLGTQLGQLMAAYEMNAFKDTYQKAVVDNAKSFAKSLAAAGLTVAGDPADGYTETHQVIVLVGYGAGPDVAEKLEQNGVIVNYQATPDEEGFTASGALRMGVSEMTRFGFGEQEFALLADLMADVILRGKNVASEVQKLRAGYTDMRYCFNDAETAAALEAFAKKTGLA